MWRGILLLACIPLSACDSTSSQSVNDLSVPPPDDAAPPSDDLSMPDMAEPLPQAMVVGSADYAGLPSYVDGTGSSDPLGRTLTFQWHVTAPPASAVTDASLTSSGTGKIAFLSDVGGSYVVTLTVSTPDGASNSATVTLDVPTVPLFYYQGSASANAQEVALGVVRSDGTGRQLLGCPIDNDAGAGANPYAALEETALFGLRTWEPPRAMLGMVPAHVAYLEVTSGDAALEYQLWTADEAGSCGTAARLDDSSSFTDHPHLFPRFSPDGKRVAYIDGNHNPGNPPYWNFTTTVTASWRVVTVGVDGTDRRVVRSPTNTIFPTPPAWLDNTHLAWVENLSGNFAVRKLVIYAATDAAGFGDPTTGSPTTVLYCYNDSSQTPLFTELNQFEFVAGGVLVAGSNGTTNHDGDPGNIGLYKMTGGACSTSNKIAEEPSPGRSWDFAVSPDGKTVVFASTRGLLPDGGTTVPPRDIWTVPADGSTPPTRLAGDRNLDDFGPRFIAGGKQVMWTQRGTDADAGIPVGGGIMVVNLDGTNPRSLYGETGGVLVLGGSNQGHVGCSWAGESGPSALWLGLGGALVLLLAARRRRC
jgi:hypothetical protein